MHTISVIIPAYNEESRLPEYLDSILEYFKDIEVIPEIIVVDDGSTDSTSAVVNTYSISHQNVNLIRLPYNRGKGFSVRTGMLAARNSLRLFADADGATPIKEVERLMGAIKNGADVAIGSRALHNDECLVKGSFHRKVMGAIFNVIVRTMAVKGIFDTQCGFKLFTKESAESVFPLQRINDFGFDVEILYLSRQRGFKIAEVPVNWKDVKSSKVKLFRDSFRMFVDIIKVRVNDLCGAYSYFDIKK